MRDENPSAQGSGIHLWYHSMKQKRILQDPDKLFLHVHYLGQCMGVPVPRQFIACTVNFSRRKQGVWKLPCMLWILLERTEKNNFLLFFSIRQTSIKFVVESADQVETCLHLT